MSFFDRIANAVTQKALSSVQQRIPQSVQKHLPLARKLLSGGVEGAASAGLDLLLERFGISGTNLPGFSNGLYQPSSLVGGVTLAQAREIFERMAAADYEKKNLWCIRVTNLDGGSLGLDFNFFATDVGYAPFAVAGDAIQIGSGFMDNPNADERVEMRVTTLDDSYGTIKRWFRDRMARMVYPNGLMGLPGDYLFRVEVMHAYADESAYGSGQALWDTYIMRPGTIEYEKSRREDGLSELQMTFVQFDTFTALT